MELIPTYISHCLSGDDRSENLADASRWVALLARRYLIEPVCSWIVLASQWEESERELGLEIDHAAIRRSQAFVATGPRSSFGMRLEESWWRERGRFFSHMCINLVGVALEDLEAINRAMLVAGIRMRAS
jgi:hypothetical protein